MKKLLLLTGALAIISTSVFAQPRKGDWMAGINIFPQSIKGGYFLTDKLIVSTSLFVRFNQHLNGTSTTVNTGLSPSLRYYMVKEIRANKFQFYADLNFAFSAVTTYDAANKWQFNRYDFGPGIGPGVQYMITDRVSVEAMTRISYRGIDNPAASVLNNVFETGIQVYLKGRKKQSDVAEMRGS